MGEIPSTLYMICNKHPETVTNLNGDEAVEQQKLSFIARLWNIIQCCKKKEEEEEGEEKKEKEKWERERGQKEEKRKSYQAMKRHG